MGKQSVDQRIIDLLDLARQEPDKGLKKSIQGAIEHFWKLENELIVGRRLEMSGLASDLGISKIELWDGDLSEAAIFIPTIEVGATVQKQILSALERRGICQVRISGQSPHKHITRAVANLIGPLTPTQNDFDADVLQLIVPKTTGAANSGNTLADLGLHVDGTQHTETPAVMVFHYVSLAKVGATSVFVDMAKVLFDIEPDRRHKLLVNLARPDAATFSKKGMTFTSPLFYFSPTGRLVCRIRFDDVIKLNSKCQKDFDYLKERANDSKYRLEFKPLDGDLVIFDNWRVLHARDEVYGAHVRQHWRGWVSNLKTAFQPDYFLGVRPFNADTAAKIEKAQGKNRKVD
jgi:alpha-ketoglutarate-dependent taurine dioxygenase